MISRSLFLSFPNYLVNSSTFRVVPFLICAILLEEVIPLIAIYIPSMLPSTCILPSQRERIDEKRTEKARNFAIEHRHIYNELSRLQEPAGYLPVDSLRLPGASTALCGCVYHLFCVRLPDFPLTYFHPAFLGYLP